MSPPMYNSTDPRLRQVIFLFTKESIQTGSEVHPASNSVDTVESAVKAAEGMKLTNHRLVPWLRMSGGTHPLLQYVFRACTQRTLLY
jgi:hypothetical protein